MTRRIIRRTQAKRDLVHHFLYLAENADVSTARRFQESAKASFQLLSEMPAIGSPRTFQDPNLNGVRIWPIKDFREFIIVYQPIENGIRVVRIIHSKQDYWLVLGP